MIAQCLFGISWTTIRWCIGCITCRRRFIFLRPFSQFVFFLLFLGEFFLTLFVLIVGLGQFDFLFVSG